MNCIIGLLHRESTVCRPGCMPAETGGGECPALWSCPRVSCPGSHGLRMSLIRHVSLNRQLTLGRGSAHGSPARVYTKGVHACCGSVVVAYTLIAMLRDQRYIIATGLLVLRTFLHSFFTLQMFQYQAKYNGRKRIIKESYSYLLFSLKNTGTTVIPDEVYREQLPRTT